MIARSSRYQATRTVTNVTRGREAETTPEASLTWRLPSLRLTRASDNGDTALHRANCPTCRTFAEPQVWQVEGYKCASFVGQDRAVRLVALNALKRVLEIKKDQRAYGGLIAAGRGEELTAR